MKYVKAYSHILERKDLEKREEILKLLDGIILVVKNHFIKIIDNLLSGKNKIYDYIFLDDDFKVKYKPKRENIEFLSNTLTIKLNKKHRFKIIITNESGGSYSKETTTGEEFLFFSFGNSFYNRLKDIFILPKEDLPEIKKEIKNYKLDPHSKDVLLHELVHATDMMKFDIYKELKKSVKIMSLFNSGKGLGDKEFDSEFFKEYPNFTTEYNAYFMMATNMLINNLKNKSIKFYEIKDYDKFKEYFTNLTNDYYDFYNKTTKFKKHFDKRMYDLYIKLKEKYDN